jgi:poly(A) polymerase Pap1
MTDDKKKHDDKEREKVADEEMEDVAGGQIIQYGGVQTGMTGRGRSVDHNSSRSNNG